MNKVKIVLLIFIILGFFLRVFWIDKVPMYGDELTIALDAKTLLSTGMDQTGEKFPLTFSMGAGRPAGYVYFSIPFIFLFGTSELGVRALSLLSGVFLIVTLYLLGKKFFNEKVGLVAAFLVSVSPWDISLSRGGFEAHFALLLATLGTLFFLYAQKHVWLYLVSAIFFGLTLHTYPTYKVTLSLFLPALFFYTNKNVNVFKNRAFILSMIVFILFIILSITQTLYSNSEGRFLRINALANEKITQEIIQQINSEREINALPGDLSRFFHNKLIEYFKLLGESYLRNFSFDFLFLHGDKNPRHNMANFGGFYLIEVITLLVGFAFLFNKERYKLLFLLVWILISPIATALLIDPHFLRSSFMLPPLILISSVGVALVINKSMPSRIMVGVVIICFAIQFIFFIEKLYFLSPNKYARFWSYGAKLASKIAFENKDKFNLIIISDKIDNIEYAYPAYGLVDSRLIIDQNKKRSQLKGYELKKFDNVYIGHIPDEKIKNFLDSLGEKTLFIGSTSEQKFLENYEILAGPDKQDLLILKKERS